MGRRKKLDQTIRGGDSIYGESITTNRAEAIGNWELPFAKQNVTLDYSHNFHQQDSYYGTTKYYAQQHTGFTQLRWDKKLKQHDLLMGLPFRFIHYDDNTPGTGQGDSISQTNAPMQTILPGVFLQDEIRLKEKLTTLVGLRYDYHNQHGSIFTPRLSFKWQPNKLNTIRLSGGNGFRVVNLFTEDHAALTGARKVVITEELKPEQSWNGNLNYTTQYFHKKGFIEVDVSIFYTYFINKFVADYTSNAQQIIYDNLKDFAVSCGTNWTLVNLQLSRKFKNELKRYGGAKKFLNFISKNPILRAEDPFDKKIGENNPNGFTFDPSYNYAPVRG